jgi:hypothetical protein
MLSSTLTWGSLIGLIHFVVTGALYGNPVVDRIYQEAMRTEPGVRRWPSRARYLVTQFLGTQVEVYGLALAYFWTREATGSSGLTQAAILGLLFTGLRVYPRFWNMFVQSTYPKRLLAIEAVNGTLSTMVIVVGLYLLAP